MDNQMSNITLTLTDIKTTFSTIVDIGYQKAGEWSGHLIKIIQTIPQHMQANPHVAIGVITTANTLFIIAINVITNRLEKCFQNSLRPLSTTKKVFKCITVNGFVAGMTLGFNVL